MVRKLSEIERSLNKGLASTRLGGHQQSNVGRLGRKVSHSLVLT